MTSRQRLALRFVQAGMVVWTLALFAGTFEAMSADCAEAASLSPRANCAFDAFLGLSLWVCGMAALGAAWIGLRRKGR